MRNYKLFLVSNTAIGTKPATFLHFDWMVRVCKPKKKSNLIFVNLNGCSKMHDKFRLLSGAKSLGGKQEESWTNGPPWQPKGVGEGEECASSHGKLKHSFILRFTKSHLSYTLDPIRVKITGCNQNLMLI